jgi:hypothetical protein
MVDEKDSGEIMGVQNARKTEARDHVGSLGAEGEVSKRFVSTVMNVRPRCPPLINPPAESFHRLRTDINMKHI